MEHDSTRRNELNDCISRVLTLIDNIEAPCGGLVGYEELITIINEE